MKKVLNTQDAQNLFNEIIQDGKRHLIPTYCARIQHSYQTLDETAIAHLKPVFVQQMNDLKKMVYNQSDVSEKILQLRPLLHRMAYLTGVFDLKEFLELQFQSFYTNPSDLNCLLNYCEMCRIYTMHQNRYECYRIQSNHLEKLLNKENKPQPCASSLRQLKLLNNFLKRITPKHLR